MRFLRRFLTRLTNFVARRRDDQRLREEMEEHLTLQTSENLRAGMAPAKARREAVLKLGAAGSIRADYHSEHGLPFFEDLLQDLRYAMRSFAKTPGLTAMIVLSLAIGIGANTAIFSVTSTLLLKPLPYPAADRIAILWLRSPGIGIPQDWPSPGQYHDIVTQNHVFEDTALALGDNFILTEGSKAIKVDGIHATSSLLQMLGAKPMLGRIFLPEEDEPGKPETVVLTYGFWRRAFASDPHIVGRAITLDGHPHTVVGVLSPSFRLNHEVIPTVAGIDKPELFMPPPDDAKRPNNYGSENYNILTRLKPGVTMQQAQADIDVIAARLRQEKHRDPSFTISVVPLIEQVVGNVRTAVLILLGAVTLVLLIACTNVANLLLSRAAERQREIAIRAALGAGRARVVRQLLTESIALSLMGGAAGMAISALSIFIARKMHPGNIPRLEELGTDFRVLGFTFAISILTGVFFGLTPALRASRVELTATLKAGGKGLSRAGLSVRRDKLRGALVIAELAISLPLLVGAGLLVRSFVRLAHVPPGFNPQRVVSMNVAAYGPQFKEPAKRVQFYQELAERTRQLPGVTATGAVSALPLTSAIGWGRVQVEGYVPPPNEPELQVDGRAATPPYFSAMEIPLIAGRMFVENDRDKTPPVAIIDQKLADRFWPHGDAIGKHIRQGDDSPWVTIVGVVGVVKEYGLDTDTRMVIYYPHAQRPRGTMYVVARDDIRSRFHDRSDDSSGKRYQSGCPGVRHRDHGAAGSGFYGTPAIRHDHAGWFRRFCDDSRHHRRLWGHVVLVAQGTAEIAIRMALGARRASILSLVFQQGMTLALVGIMVGFLGALGLTRMMSSLLFGVKPTDPFTFLSVLALLFVVALFACLLPASRAMRIDPMIALRTD